MELKTSFKLWIVKSIMMVYDVITFPAYFFVQQPWKKRRSSKEVWARLTRGDDPYSPCVRVTGCRENLLDSVETLDELFHLSVVRHGLKRCLGVRDIRAESEECSSNGQICRKLCLGEYRWFSFVDVDQRIDGLCKGLIKLGLTPRKQIAIFAETRIEWMLICQACFRINVPVATIYTTLGEEGITHVLNETEVTHLFTSQEMLPKLKKIVQKTPLVNKIIYMENLRLSVYTGFDDKISVIPLSQVENTGKICGLVSLPEPPDANDLAVIMYTSGSTGIPKGVMLTHNSMVVSASNFVDCFPNTKENDVHMAYLPLAHAFEIMTEIIFFIMGIPIGYSSPHTMIDQSTAIMSGCKGDATLLQPTILTAVPLTLDRIRKGESENSVSKGLFGREFLEFAVGYKTFWRKKGFNTPLLNMLFFQDIKDMIGGNVRAIICGGAPLSPDTHEFMRTCFDVKLLQIYGITETAGSASIMGCEDYSTGRVGAPLRSSCMRLVDWPEGNYYATDRPRPRGEMVIGGASVTLGYFKNKALTDECFKVEDGNRWFYTGDIGELYPDGTFKIIDRKKDLVKLQYGQYVSLGTVESELKTCPLVDNICVVGNGYHDYLVALVVPNPLQLKAVASSMGKNNLTLQKLCQDTDILEKVVKVMADQGRKSKLRKTEIPSRVKLCSEEWHPETGLVTATLKIKRKNIEKFYQHDIEEMFTLNTNVS